MSTNLIILILCYIVMIGILIFIPQNTKKLLQNAGNLIFSYGRNTNIRFYTVCVVAFLLVFIVYFGFVSPFYYFFIANSVPKWHRADYQHLCVFETVR